MYFATFIPNWRPLFSTSSSNSVNDFFPKFLNFNKSFLLNETKSPKVSISAAFKQFNALTLRSISTNLVFNEIYGKEAEKAAAKKRTRRGGAKKKEEGTEVAGEATEAAVEKPKAKRAPRKKADDTSAE